MATSWVCALCYAIDGPAAVGSGLPVRLPACLPRLSAWLAIHNTTTAHYYLHDRFCTLKLRLCAP